MAYDTHVRCNYGTLFARNVEISGPGCQGRERSDCQHEKLFSMATWIAEWAAGEEDLFPLAGRYCSCFQRTNSVPLAPAMLLHRQRESAHVESRDWREIDLAQRRRLDKVFLTV